MPAYRFCRPDDIPLLVRAVNECYNGHFPDHVPWTVEDFRAEMKEINVWPSNSLTAMSGDDPIAVLIGTKRPDEVLVLRLGVRTDYQRQGHGRHLLTSLSQKLAVLGPPRLAAEVPDDLPGVGDFFAAVGYEREADLTDWTRSAGELAGDSVPAELVIPITVEEAREQGLVQAARSLAWARAVPSILGRGEKLEGLAIATPERVEACLFFRRGRVPLGGFKGGKEVLAAECQDAERESAYLSLLLRFLIGQSSEPIVFPKLAPGELPPELLEGLGFVPARRYGRYVTLATPA